MRMLLKNAKRYSFIIFIILVYTLVAVISPSTIGVAAKNSVYYLKEMLMIMPVIFVLTALLDIWMPKEYIIRYIGRESGITGILLSFVLGSMSAGPVYAAFPVCVMLHKKGASVRNIVVILSSWAVIKLPMLLNEIKFLGFRFMIIRWLLTVVAIIIFSWITAELVTDEEVVHKDIEKAEVVVNRKLCIGCKVCASRYPELFEMRNGKADAKENDIELDKEKLENIILKCPVKAINIK